LYLLLLPVLQLLRRTAQKPILRHQGLEVHQVQRGRVEPQKHRQQVPRGPGEGGSGAAQEVVQQQTHCGRQAARLRTVRQQQGLPAAEQRLPNLSAGLGLGILHPVAVHSGRVPGSADAADAGVEDGVRVQQPHHPHLRHLPLHQGPHPALLVPLPRRQHHP